MGEIPSSPSSPSSFALWGRYPTVRASENNGQARSNEDMSDSAQVALAAAQRVDIQAKFSASIR